MKNIIRLHIKQGFKTNFGSIPKFAQGWIDAQGSNTLAFLFHDAMYVGHGISRETCDNMMYDALRLAGMGYFKAQAVYHSVDWFGEEHFKSDDMSNFFVHMTWDDK